MKYTNKKTIHKDRNITDKDVYMSQCHAIIDYMPIEDLEKLFKSEKIGLNQFNEFIVILEF